MKFQGAFARAIASAMVATTVTAAAMDCSQEHFRPATTMSALPQDIRAALARATAVADAGAPWEMGDVGPFRYPPRRIVMTAVGASRAYVALEHGGGPILSEFWVFERHGAHWTGAETQQDRSIDPQSMQDLLYYSGCDGYQRFDPARTRLASHVAPDGSLVLEMTRYRGALARYRLHPAVAAHGRPGRDAVTNEMVKGERLSTRERIAVGNELSRLREGVPDDDPTQKVVDRLLAALAPPFR